MIKDNFLNQDFSNFGGENENYIINSKFFDEKLKKELQETEEKENLLYAKTKIGYFSIETENYEEGAKPYQVLLFSIASKLENGIIIDKNNDKNILTFVKNKIPLFSNLIISNDPNVIESNIKRIYTSQAITLSEDSKIQTIYINEKDYDISEEIETFLTLDEIKQKEKVLLLKIPFFVSIILFLSLYFLYYVSISIYSTFENQKLQNTKKALEKTKQEIIIKLTDTKEKVDYHTIIKEIDTSEKMYQFVKTLKSKEPISIIAKPHQIAVSSVSKTSPTVTPSLPITQPITQSQENSYIIKNVSPNFNTLNLDFLNINISKSIEKDKDIIVTF